MEGYSVNVVLIAIPHVPPQFIDYQSFFEFRRSFPTLYVVFVGYPRATCAAGRRDQFGAAARPLHRLKSWRMSSTLLTAAFRSKALGFENAIAIRRIVTGDIQPEAASPRMPSPANFFAHMLILPPPAR